jgi:hypothetical protein
MKETKQEETNEAKEFAYRLIKFPGYMAFGSVIMITAAVLGIFEAIFIRP